MNRDKIMILIFIIIAGGIFYYFQSLQDTTRLDETIGPLKQKIAAANRPRVINFTAPWCPACKQLKPVLNEVMNNYSRSVDCEILNVNDKGNLEMVRSFRVKAIPVTYVFDRKGNLVFKHVGYMGTQELDNQIRKTIL
jgi:thioredoxin 1